MKWNWWRGAFNVLGILSTLLSFCLLISSWATSSWPLFLSSLCVNYLITAIASADLIHSTRKSDLLITFYLFIFLLAPYIGISLYFLLGCDSIYTRNVDKYSKICSKYRTYSKDSSPTILDIGELDSFKNRTFFYNHIKHKAHVYRDVDMKILQSSIDTLNEITDLLEKAKHFICMEFYLFCDGLVFEHVLNILNRKIKEGVSVRIIIDYVGNFRRLSKSSRERLLNIGVELRLFNPFFSFNKLWLQFRNHNKMIIVDNEYALCGSCNIADEYFNITAKHFQTTELSARLSGPIVESLTASFLSHWDLCDKSLNYFWKKKENDSEKEILNLQEFKLFPDRKVSKTGVIAQFLDNSPISNEKVIKDNLIQLIFNAKKSIIISTPYFFPPKDLINALKQVSIFGVSVKVLVPKNPDLMDFFRTLNRQWFSVLLEQNIEVYEYFGFNHEKLMIVDDETVYFGSYNWDYRALYLNFENAILVKSKSVTASAVDFMEKQFKNSHKIFLEDVKASKGAWYFRAIIRIFKPLL